MATELRSEEAGGVLTDEERHIRLAWGGEVDRRRQLSVHGSRRRIQQIERFGRILIADGDAGISVLVRYRTSSGERESIGVVLREVARLFELVGEIASSVPATVKTNGIGELFERAGVSEAIGSATPSVL